MPPTPGTNLHALYTSAAAVCLALLMCACEPAPTDGSNTQPVSPDQAVSAEDAWQPTPRSIRVYPSTRFIQESGRAILEARFELFDEMGDAVKSGGAFQIELYSVDESLGSTPQRLLYSWSTQTLTLDQQREHYDPITRGYLFRLGVDNLRIAKQPTLLKVAFTSPVRPRLEAEAVIRSDW